MRNKRGERMQDAEGKQYKDGAKRSVPETHTQRGGEMETEQMRQEGHFEKWGMSINRESLGDQLGWRWIWLGGKHTGYRVTEGNIKSWNMRVKGISKHRQVGGREARKTVKGSQTKNGGGRWNQASHTSRCVCGLLATLSAMHLFLNHYICTKQDVSLVIRDDPRFYFPLTWSFRHCIVSILQLLSLASNIHDKWSHMLQLHNVSVLLNPQTILIRVEFLC